MVDMVKINEIAEYVSTGVEKYEGEKKYFSTGSVKSDGKEFEVEGIYTYNKKPSRANRLAQKHDVFQARMKSTNKPVLIDDELDNALFSTGFIQLRPKKNHEIMSKYLYYLLQSPHFLLKRDKLATGTTQVALNDRNAFRIELPLIKEEFIEGTISQVDNFFSKYSNIANTLNRTVSMCNIAKTSIFFRAIRGGLTKSFRNTANEFTPIDKTLEEIVTTRKKHHQILCSESKKLERSSPRIYKSKTAKDSSVELFELPKDWKWIQLGELLNDLTDYHANGSYKTLKENVTLLDENGYALMVRATNFEKDSFDSDVKFVSKNAYNYLYKSKLFGDEILIGKIGNAGSVYLMPKIEKPASVAMNLFILRISEAINCRYIYYHLLSSFSKRDINSYVKGVGNPTIDKKSVMSLWIALPPKEEQDVIVQELEQRLSVLETTSADVSKTLSSIKLVKTVFLNDVFMGGK